MSSRMTRRAARLGALALALAAVGVPASPAAAAYPARLLVYAQEWSLYPSRATLPAGRVIVELWNRGMDAHDLRARRLAGRRMIGHTFAVHTTLPGRVSSATWTLAPGRYELYCSMPGHLQAGMHVVITVRRHR